MKLTKLKRVAVLRAGGTPSVQAERFWRAPPDGVPWVAIGDMSDGGLVSHTARHVSPEGIADKRLPVGTPGTVLFAMYASLGAVAELAVEASWNQALLGIEPLHGASERRFVRYWLEHLRPSLGALARSNTQDNLNAEQVANLCFPVLSVGAQRAIADYLDIETGRIDALISKKRRMIELLNERKRLLGEEVIANLRRSEEHVPMKYLVHESDVRYGIGSEPTMLAVSIHHGVVPRDAVTDRPMRTTDYSRYKVCRPGDIAINRMRAFQGGVGVVSEDGVVSPDYTVLRVGEEVSANYLHFLMRSSWFVSEMIRRLRGIGATDQGQVRTPRINYADLGLIQIPVPAISQQQLISCNLAEQEALLAHLNRLLTKQVEVIEQRRQALITRTVTGRLAIPGAPA